MRLRALAIAPALLLLAACGDESGDSPSDQTTTTTASARTQSSPKATPPATPTTSVRGHLIKKIGEVGGVRDHLGAHAVDFTLTDVELTTNCGGSGRYPNENGQFAILSFDVTTGINVDTSQFGNMFNPNTFSAVTADNRTVTNVATTATYDCPQTDEAIPDRFAAGSNYSGHVVLDVPMNTTAITFMPDSNSGWEWAIPAS